jgi:hypothetical protein
MTERKGSFGLALCLPITGRMSSATSGEAEKWIHEKLLGEENIDSQEFISHMPPMYQIDISYHRMTFYPGMPIEGWSDD